MGQKIDSSNRQRRGPKLPNNWVNSTSSVLDAQNCGETEIFYLAERPFRHGCAKKTVAKCKFWMWRATLSENSGEQVATLLSLRACGMLKTVVTVKYSFWTWPVAVENRSFCGLVVFWWCFFGGVVAINQAATQRSKANHPASQPANHRKPARARHFQTQPAANQPLSKSRSMQSGITEWVCGCVKVHRKANCCGLQSSAYKRFKARKGSSCRSCQRQMTAMSNLRQNSRKPQIIFCCLLLKFCHRVTSTCQQKRSKVMKTISLNDSTVVIDCVLFHSLTY